ncbi:MAG: hypothetical protein WC180_05415 [Candidatus Paceibacterota bacterium]
MSILPKINPEKLRTPGVRALFIVWFFFSILTVFAFYFQIRALNHIDIPTHIGAGLVIAAFIYVTVKVKNGRQALMFAFIPFLLWELIEIGISSGVTGGGFLFRLFNETINNRIQDVVMDTLGFLVYMIMTGKRF